jgi:Fibrinogen beta and gamma chains, C-terminal globular domain
MNAGVQPVIIHDCKDVLMCGGLDDGVYRVNITGVLTPVYCDMTTAGGGWLVGIFHHVDSLFNQCIQRKLNYFSLQYS